MDRKVIGRITVASSRSADRRYEYVQAPVVYDGA
jgi:hypothetical protein